MCLPLALETLRVEIDATGDREHEARDQYEPHGCDMALEIDQGCVQALIAEIFVPIRQALLARPHSPDNVFVVLNALAVAAATVIAGTDERAQQFFEDALRGNIGSISAGRTN